MNQFKIGDRVRYSAHFLGTCNALMMFKNMDLRGTITEIRDEPEPWKMPIRVTWDQPCYREVSAFKLNTKDLILISETSDNKLWFGF